ncbi:McrC family protein [Devosia rhizoryzae]|uniref:Calmodulin-binding protein n=1 Tax=Devosia rhizoryzae TaxID=2774137 RepID=A0ABX7CA71_9HYPH|nr:calmodulin-binding protein [Devosia rhizoryzae]QQR40678.1 calmodulin-binding protein [Devosia rhizoryzae]
MTHRTISEWGKVAVGDGGYTRQEANLLLAAARTHPSGGREGTRILADHHRHLTARQVVGVLAAGDSTLEILPKVDPASPAEDSPTVRRRLLHMLDVALELQLSTGQDANLARQDETLLDVLIRLFADDLLAEVRRGLPRQYAPYAEDLPALRGRLDITRQFTVHAVRPDRLASKFDVLDPDTPLMRIMKACVLALLRYARVSETQRKLAELRFVLADIPDAAPRALPWAQVRLDRSNIHWKRLYELAALFLRRNWQGTSHDAVSNSGITLLFPMNDLFEAYIAAQLRRALVGTGMNVTAQGGLRYCLGEWHAGQESRGTHFQTKPDIIVRNADREIAAIVDTKWKKLAWEATDRRVGVGQADVYQVMAYARVYRCDRLMLLFPATPGEGSGTQRRFGIAGGKEQIDIATIDVTGSSVAADLRQFFVPA